ncbi:protein-lysine N-methyltransferase EEF2KMT isoform X2 [Orussus abietinus]|uniref:protein-lysine N-methyltransferase EEF2KMT isoform X2 n=1 Tax=Orussus abietinus TaxID=222816 RepID=UPI0006261A56|nr:protein-lysine N-methyltransferase EEF2KMT isoform X2 [Orussus abietinus]
MTETIDVEYIQKQFLCCTPVTEFNFAISGHSEECQLTLDIQKAILDNTVNDDLVRKYPIKRSYQKAFLKLLINKLERSCEELHDDIYDLYCTLLSYTESESQTHYQHYMIPRKGSVVRILLCESTNIISMGTTGLCSWQGASRLAEWCITNDKKLEGKTILELGSGVGLTGLVVINSCLPKHYIFSDCHPAVLDMLCRNVRRNLGQSTGQCLEKDTYNEFSKLNLDYNGNQVEVVDLPWENIEKNESEYHITPDVILAADVVYDYDIIPALIQALTFFLSRSNCYAVIAITNRNEDTISRFLDQLEPCIRGRQERISTCICATRCYTN